MRKGIWVYFVVLAIAAAGGISTAAIPETKEKIGTPLSADETKYDFHNPLPWLEIGADARFRMIRERARKLDKNTKSDDRFWQRYRARLWTRMNLADVMDFNMRIVTEPRYYGRRDDLEHRFIRHEALFDRFNIELKNVFGLPVTAKIGRQDLQLGSNWLILEGTPLDGSRTSYFDAARFTCNLDEYDSTLDIIWVDNHADSGRWLKPFNDRNLDIAEQDERGIIAYLSNRLDKNAQIDGYFIYKNDRNRNRANGTEGNIYTLGSMIKGFIDDKWGYQIEVAPQFGHKNGKELGAFGSNNRLSYNLHDKKDNIFHVGYEYLSGNKDPDKHFDRVWARESRYSDLYNGCIDSIDGRELDGSNLHRPNFGWSIRPTDKMQIVTDYSLIFADKNTRDAGTNGMSKHGKFRGQLVKLQVKYKFNKHVHNRFTAECFLPGNFYNRDRNDVAMFLRYGIVFTW